VGSSRCACAPSAAPFERREHPPASAASNIIAYTVFIALERTPLGAPGARYELELGVLGVLGVLVLALALDALSLLDEVELAVVEALVLLDELELDALDPPFLLLLPE
jgi:hypothetical protein